MPLRGENHSEIVTGERPFFLSLAELDTWFAQPHDKHLGVVPYQPRPSVGGQSGGRAKLLNCHELSIRGVYPEEPHEAGYTFNFWRLCDVLVTFSHRRITLPTSGWTNAGHKQGTKVLGTLVLEGAGNTDTLQLVVGRSGFSTTDNKIPVSEHYAVLLAELAYQRGFDGYFLNVESSLRYGTNHARALAAWILLLRAQLRDRVGPHAEVVWYDSVIYNGNVSYQHRLNAYNLPFFLASDALFTDYGWRPNTQRSMSTYFTSVKGASSAAATKTLQDVYSGIDFYGRKTYGGGGFNCYRALTHTSPLGISTAIFSPSWTWRASWEEGWERERKLWLGPYVNPPPDPPEGPFKPIADFFQDLPCPDPSKFAFYTNFSPGAGFSWFVEGKMVLESTEKGWFDIDKQCSIGNLTWPSPTISWHGVEQPLLVPTASTAFDMTDGYNGGNTLNLIVQVPGSNLGGDTRTIWVPIQSLTLSTGVSFDVRIVYKTTAPDGVELHPRIHAKCLPTEENADVNLTVRGAISSDLQLGWTSQVVSFTCTSTRQALSTVEIGLIIAISAIPSSLLSTFTVSLGQLAVYPTPPPASVSVGNSSVTEAKFTPSSNSTPTALQGVLTWDTKSTFDPITVQRPGAEDTIPVWLLQDTPAYRHPTFVYFNIYVAQVDDSGNANPANAVFIGTTGYDGRANRFYLDSKCMPDGSDRWTRMRFYVQGVTDRGEVLPWDRCASVDHRNNVSGQEALVVGSD